MTDFLIISFKKQHSINIIIIWYTNRYMICTVYMFQIRQHFPSRLWPTSPCSSSGRASSITEVKVSTIMGFPARMWLKRSHFFFLTIPQMLCVIWYVAMNVWYLNSIPSAKYSNNDQQPPHPLFCEVWTEVHCTVFGDDMANCKALAEREWVSKYL